MIYTVPHYVNGQQVQAPTLNRFEVFNSAQGKCIGEVHAAEAKLCESAIAAAKNAYPAWAETPPAKRARVLFKFREKLEQYQDDLARLVTQEHGKTLDDARGSVARAIELVEFHCGLAAQWQGAFSPNVAQQIDSVTLRQPLGVCAGVSPFNFPVMVPIWMMIPAIACGNAFILKPSEQVPSAPVRLMELLSEAGLPAGVVNCLHGGKETVDYLLDHTDIAAFTAVASTPVAQSIYTRATQQGKRAHTFGGAKNHGVVMPDADFEQAAQAITGAAYGSAGERCMALSVVVTVGQATAERLLEKLLPLIQAIRVGAGEEPGCDMGPLISQAHHARVVQAIEQGVSEQAKLLVDGRAFRHPQYPDGYFIGPTLFDEVTEFMSIYQQEIFGPVLVMLRVDSFEEALALVNRNQYGNGTAIFTQNGYTAREYSQRVQVGMVGVNVPIPVPVAHHPFGGWKRSAFGDTHMHGTESLQFYTRRKTITSKWLTSESDSALFAMPNHL